MKRRDRAAERISLRLLIALSDEVTAVPPARRERYGPCIGPETWRRMTPLERILAADREDPDFDYAAN
jgi:hypothetical protein